MVVSVTETKIYIFIYRMYVLYHSSAIDLMLEFSTNIDGMNWTPRDASNLVNSPNNK